jgi:drug/metabolite transporter (DMT)-like permease
MLGIVLALGAAVCWGSGDFLGGLSTRRASLWAVVTGSQLVGLAAAAAVVLASGRPWPGLAALWPILIGGLAGAVAIATFYKALAIGTMSIVAPITASSAIVPMLVGLARGERPSPLQVAGIMLAALGVMFAASERQTGRPESAEAEDAPGSTLAAASQRRRSIILALIAALGIGLMLVGYDASAEHDALWAMFGGRIASASFFAVFLLAVRPPLRAPRAVIPLIVGVGLLDTGANGFFAFATTYGLLSLAAVIGSLYPVVTVVLAYTLLHERIARHQLIGVVAALAGVALISGG